MTRRRVDTRHAEIRDVLDKLGALVVDTSAVGNGRPDMAALWKRECDKVGRTVWLEVKSVGQARRKGVTASRQKRFAEEADERGVEVHVVETPEEAVEIVFKEERHGQATEARMA